MNIRSKLRRAVLLAGLVCLFHSMDEAVCLAQTPVADTIESRFARLDTDGNGKLEGDEITDERVRRFDANGDGVIPLDEVLSAAGALSKNRRKRGAAPPPTSGGPTPVVTRDVRYTVTDGVDAIHQSLDIHSFSGAKDAPVLVYVHGGGWANGDKGNVSTAPKAFNALGYVYVSVNYRLLPQGKHPNNIDDLAHALAWVHDHIAEYGGDPNNIFLYGHSAGAHLVALLATDERRLKAAGKDLSILKGVIPLDTNAYDIVTLTSGGGSASLYAKVFGDDPAACADAAPFAHVAPNKGIPPMLIFHSNAGYEARNAQGAAFVKRLKEAGVDAELIPSPNQTHAQINQRFGASGDMVTTAALKFFNRLRSSPSAGAKGN